MELQLNFISSILSEIVGGGLTFVIHWVLAIILFFIINWIGSHSYSLGYMEVTLFVKNEEAPALNFLIRVLTPIVYLIITSAIIYSLKADRFVYNIYLVNVYYLIFRLGFGIITGRSRLINWYRQVLYWIAIVVISYITYSKVIKIKTNILPDFTTVANELWIIILVFIFQVCNNIRLSQSHVIQRKEDYLKYKYQKFKKLYGEIIKDNLNNDKVEALAYAILIYEDFNRPRVIRFIENLSFKLRKKPHTP